jgi:hypothetical protein
MKTSFKLIVAILYLVVFFYGTHKGYDNAERVQDAQQRIVYVYVSMPEQIQNISAQRAVTPVTSPERPMITLETWQKNAVLFLLISGQTLFILPVPHWFYTQGYLTGMMISKLIAEGGQLNIFLICATMEMVIFTLGVVWVWELTYDFWYVKLFKNRDFKTDPMPLFRKYLKRVIACLTILVVAALIEDYLGLIIG